MVQRNNSDDLITLSLDSLLLERQAAKYSSGKTLHGKGPQPGTFETPYRGKGAVYDQLRQYQAGDDLRHIDWKATARTNKLHTRVFRDEREQLVRIILDFRSSMFTGSQQLQAVSAGRIAARALWQAVDGGSRCDCLVLTDKACYLSPPTKNASTALQLCHFIASTFSYAKDAFMQNLLNDISHRDGPGNNNRFSPADFLVDLDKYTWDKSQAVPLVVIAQWLASSTQKRTNLLWISAFDLAGEHFSDALQVLDTRCQQIAILIEDSMTQQVLPNGKYAYQSYAKYHETVDKVRLQCRVAMISRKSQSSLGDRLVEHRRARVNLLEAATIPVIGLSEPNTVIRELRQFGFLP